jgi:hypothetical protein
MRVTYWRACLGAVLSAGAAWAQVPAAAAEPAPVSAPAPVPAAAPAPAAAAPDAASAAKAPAATAALQTPEQLAAQRGWSLAASLDHAMGHGTFVAPSQLALVTARLGVQPRYSFRGPGAVRLLASANANFSLEYTRPDSATGRRVDWSDLRLGLSAPAVVREPHTGLVLTPSLALTAPISRRSRWAGTLAVLSTAASVTRVWDDGRWVLSAGVGGTRGFHRSATVGPGPGEPVRHDAAGIPLFLPRAGQELAAALGLNSAWSASGSLSAQFQPTDAFFFTASTGLARTWRYAATDTRDPYTPPATDTQGRPVAQVGMGAQDLLSVAVGAGYSLSPWLSLALGISHAAPPRTADNRSWSVPFVRGAVGNATTYSLSLSALR